MNAERQARNVLIVDDSPVFLDAAEAWVAGQPGLRLVGTARDGREAIEACARLAPDVVVIDAFMPGMDGFAATRQLKSRDGAPWIVMVSVHEGSTIEREAWAAGADAFVVKSNLVTELPAVLARLRKTGEGPRAIGSDRPPQADAPEAPMEQRAIETRSIVERVMGLIRGFQLRKGENSMKNKIVKGLGVASLAVLVGTSATLAAGGRTTFTPLGTPNASPWGMTKDGSKIVGLDYNTGGYFTWTKAEGLVEIGGGGQAGTIVISGDGTTIAASVFDESGNGAAAKWLGGTDWKTLDPIPGAVPCGNDLTSAWGIDYYGQTLVGLGWLPQECRAHGVSWDLVGGGPATDLGSLVPNRATRGNAISGDGHIIVGWQDDEVGNRLGARWVNGVEEYVVTPAGENVGEVDAINFDGTVMIGSSYPYGNGVRVAWVWTARKGFTGIDSGPVYSYNVATAVSEDGSVVGGLAREQSNGRPRAWVYKNNTFTWLTDLANNKKKLAPGWIITSVAGISADGTTLVGEGINPAGELEGFIIENF